LPIARDLHVSYRAGKNEEVNAVAAREIAQRLYEWARSNGALAEGGTGGLAAFALNPGTRS